MIKGGWHQTLAKGARPECFRHWRLWAGFGDWEWTKVKDVVFESLFCKITGRAKSGTAGQEMGVSSTVCVSCTGWNGEQSKKDGRTV